MFYVFRLTKGMDLKKEIEDFVMNNKISGVILSSVGSLSHLTIRLADGKSILNLDGEFEIVSVTGTLSPDGVHIHISVGDREGNVIGGHLKNGCIVHTTCEVVLGKVDPFQFRREMDEETGYQELVVTKEKDHLTNQL